MVLLFGATSHKRVTVLVTYQHARRSHSLIAARCRLNGLNFGCLNKGRHPKMVSEEPLARPLLSQYVVREAS